MLRLPASKARTGRHRRLLAREAARGDAFGVVALWIALWLLLGVPCSVRAQAEPITSNDYSVDLFTGPVYGAGRILGMGGAHTAIAAGIDGVSFTPAAYAERAEKEIRFWELDPTGGIWAGGVFKRNDLDNNGKSGLDSAQALQLSLGLRLQLSSFGSGISGLVRKYTLTDSNDKAFATVRNITVRYGLGYAFLNGGIVVGAALVQTNFNIATAGTGSVLIPEVFDPTGGDNLVRFRAFGGEFGVLMRPQNQRYRVGAAFHTPLNSRPRDDRPDTDGVSRAEGLVLPKNVHVPWELDLGMAYQFGERRTNVSWRNTRELTRELTKQISEGTYAVPDAYGETPYEKLSKDPDRALQSALEIEGEAQRRLRRHQPRRYVLVAADLLIYGKTDRGQSLNAFLLQSSEASGRRLSIGARVGVESEVWQDRMKVRAGSYLEPSRTNRKYYRPHFTAGIDVRLFDFWRWSARGTLTTDIAPRYFNWAIAFGLWW